MILEKDSATTLKENSDKPLYRQVADQLLALIAEQKLAPGAQLPPARKIQKYFNVSAITVEAGIRLLVKEGYLRRRPRLGTFICDNPPDIEHERIMSENTVGMIIKVIFCHIAPADIYWSLVWDELVTAAPFLNCDKSFAILNSDTLSDDELQRYAGGCDGVVLCGYIPLDLVKLLERKKIPFVMIGGLNSGAPPPPYADSVQHDEVHRAYISTRHLLELGHRNIVCVVGPSGSRLAEEIISGYRQAMLEYKIPREQHYVENIEAHTVEEGQQAGLRILTRVPRPTAVNACDDRLAIGVYKAATQMGFRIPEHLSLIGCGGLEIGKVITPELTTMPSHPRRSAKIALEKLFARIFDPNHKCSATILRFDELEIGGSTRFIRGEDTNS